MFGNPYQPGRGNAKRGNPSSGQFATWQIERQLEILASTVSTTLTNTVVLINELVLPSDIWTIALNGGGDLRFATDIQGVNRLAIEIVSFNTATQKAEIWVLVPSIDDTVNTSLYFWYGKSGATQPAVGAAFGKYATWPTRYQAVYHFEGNGNDSTSRQINPVGSTATFPAGKIGLCSDFELSSSQYIDYGKFDNVAIDEIQFQFWIKPESLNIPTSQSIMMMDTAGLNLFHIVIPINGDQIQLWVGGNSPQGQLGDPVISTAAWQMYTVWYGATSADVDFRRNYSQLDNDVYVTANNIDIDKENFMIGAWMSGVMQRFFDGQLDEMRVIKSTTDTRFEFEYKNQNLVTDTIQLMPYTSR